MPVLGSEQGSIWETHRIAPKASQQQSSPNEMSISTFQSSDFQDETT